MVLGLIYRQANIIHMQQYIKNSKICHKIKITYLGLVGVNIIDTQYIINILICFEFNITYGVRFMVCTQSTALVIALS